MPDVTDIIQYDPPSDSKDYIHRIGRTARLGKQGSAFLFLLPSEVEYLTILQELSCNLAEIPLVTLLQTLLPLCKSRVSKKNAAYQVAATDVHMNFERFVISDKTVHFS